ncbi:MAG: hypothetical protein ACOC2F_04315 [Bacteroidota bacterium]
MIASISTVMNTTPEGLWNKIRKPKSLQYVAAPILSFLPQEDTDLSEDWQLDKEYKLKLYMLKFIALGEHRIVLKKMDIASNEIESNEYGKLAKVWNHTMRWKSINSKQIEYTDIIEIKAGLLTVFIWLFAHTYYRYRQRRWKSLLSVEKIKSE